MDAIDVLDTHGGPFDSASYRQALVETMPGMADLSWCATNPDGVTAAVALVGDRRLADSVAPSAYGSLVSSGRLTAEAAASFLSGARRAAGADRLAFRTVPLPDDGAVDWSFAQTVGQASAIAVAPDDDPRAKFRRLAVRSVRRAEAAGAVVRTTANGEAFLGLYTEASAEWNMKYPAELVLRLGEVGVARFDEVWLDDKPVSALMTLRGSSHWMCWLASQNADGRAISASYLAYDAVLRDARTEVPFVNLGASAPGTSGLEFKRRLGAEEFPIHAWEAAGWVGRLRQMRSRWITRARG
jgi:Acetyltransferase (GNAT) domain